MSRPISAPIKQIEVRFFNRIYTWMSMALTLTGLTSVYVVATPALRNLVLSSPLLIMGLFIVQLIMVASLSTGLQRMQTSTATMLFLIYAILNGITLSGLFLLYTGASIALAFFITAGTFIAMSIYGSTTQSDLSDLGKLAMMGLIGIIIASIVNIFLQSNGLYWLISYIGVAVFVGLIAFDTQKLKRLLHQGTQSEEAAEKLAILGALTLYLDFLNLFIMILRIVGNRSRDF